MKTIILAVFTVMCLGFQNIFAEETADVFLSLTRKAEPTGNLPTNLASVSSDDIKKTGARTLGEALEFTANLNVGKYGTLGSMSSVILRGALDKQILLLIDGRPANDITLGGFNYGELNTENIERIEIIRGAASSVYGANALAGVINVVTKETCLEETTTDLSTSFGNYGEKTVGLNVARKIGSLEGAISGNKSLAEGFRENSSLDGNNLNVYLGYNSEKTGKLKLKSGFSQINAGMPGKSGLPIEQWDNITERAAYDPLAKQITDKNYLTLSNEKEITSNIRLFSSLYGSMDLGRYTSPKSYTDDSTDKRTVGLEMRCALPYGMTAGYELKEDRALRVDELLKTVSFDKRITWNSLYFQEEYAPVSKLNTILGLRYDNHSYFGGELCPQLTVIFKPVKNWKFSSNVGKSYRAPSFEDLFSPYSSWPAWGSFPGGDSQGNPDIKPETSLSFDVGAEKQWKENVSAQITLYRQSIDNLIEWSVVNNDPAYEQWRPSNVSEAYSQGVEIELKHRISGSFSYNLNYTYLEGKGKKKTELEYTTLMYRPANTVNMVVSYAAPWKINLALTGKYTGEQFDEADKPIKPYGLVGIKIEKLLFGYSKAFVSFDNITNTRYLTRSGYPMPGSAVRCGMNITF